MTLEQFIVQNREEIDCYINQVLNYVPATASCHCPQSRTEHTHTKRNPLGFKEVRLWVLNDEGLYSWARAEGVREGDEEED